jgi:hypothetical protein
VGEPIAIGPISFTGENPDQFRLGGTLSFSGARLCFRVKEKRRPATGSVGGVRSGSLRSVAWLAPVSVWLQ